MLAWDDYVPNYHMLVLDDYFPAPPAWAWAPFGVPARPGRRLPGRATPGNVPKMTWQTSAGSGDPCIEGILEARPTWQTSAGSGEHPKWALGPSGPGPKWARAQVGPGPKWARAQAHVTHKWLWLWL